MFYTSLRIYKVTRDGQPLRKRRYLFTEAFGVIALAAYARATGEEQAAEEARALFRLIIDYHTKGKLPPKTNPAVRREKSLAMPMILLSTARILWETLEDPLARSWITRSLEEIRRDFIKPELECVMETVAADGGISDHFSGRTLNPGHTIECAWFILHETRRRGGDQELVRTGTQMLDWMWKRGWDTEYGGIYYFRDVKGLPVQKYWHDMKFWWPQTEAIIATLLAWHLTGDRKYADRHSQVHDWAYAHFPDPEYGEWYGYLHRDGSLSVPLKGNLWKGPFHLPRMQWYCWQLLEGRISDKSERTRLLACPAYLARQKISDRRNGGGNPVMGTLSFSPIDIAIILLYMVGLLVVGWYFRQFSASGLENYFLAGRKVPGWVNGISYAATSMNTDVAPAETLHLPGVL